MENMDSIHDIKESKHTFIFPFKWDKYIGSDSYTAFNKRVVMKDIYDKLCSSQDWKAEYADEGVRRIKDYNEYTYFYNNVRDAIYGNDQIDAIEKRTVLNFVYKEGKQGEYIISYRMQDGSIQKYELKLDKILLKIYATGIGILSYFVTNDKYNSMHDVRRINEFGRRIFPQFIDDNKRAEEIKNLFLADSLEIKIDDKSFVEKFDSSYDEDGNKVANIIEGVLGNNSFTSIKDSNHGQRKHNKSFVIKPLLDDRMFVMCTTVSNNMSNFLRQQEDNTYAYEDSEEWYRYIFCEMDECCCLNTEMLKKKISEHTYARWIGDGSLYGMSEYSFMLLTNTNHEYLLNHMKTMYYQIVCLLLAQRGSMLRYQNELTDISSFIREKECKSEINEMIQEIHANYLCFSNGIYFREVSSQEQGREIYDLAQTVMGFKESIDHLKEDINEILQYATSITAKRNESMLNTLTYLSAIFMVPSLLAGICGMNIFVGDNLDIQNITYVSKLFALSILMGMTFFGIVIIALQKPMKWILENKVCLFIITLVCILLQVFVKWI